MAETKVTSTELALGSGVGIFNGYSTTDISSSGTSSVDLSFATLTITLPAGTALVHLSAQQSMAGFTYYGLRTTSVPSGASSISFIVAQGAASSAITHNLDGWKKFSVTVPGTYTFVVTMSGDTSTRTQSAYQYVQYMILPLGS